MAGVVWCGVDYCSIRACVYMAVYSGYIARLVARPGYFLAQKQRVYYKNICFCYEKTPKYQLTQTQHAPE